MAVSNGNGATGGDRTDTLDLEWHDEQSQRVRAVVAAIDVGAADPTLRSVIAAGVPARSTDVVAGIGVFRDLLRVEHRPDRFRRLLTIWSGKVASAVRSGDFEAAGLWMRSLVEAPVFAEEFAADVAAARRDLSRGELFDRLVTGLVSAEVPASAGPLLAAWGEPLVDYLVGQMVTPEPIVNRRHIVEFLGMAGRGDVRLLTARLADPRWFIVRNVATAIGRSGRATAVPALESSLTHEDDRVRVEVVRALAVLRGDESTESVLAAFADPSPKVRLAAASLLRANPSPEVITGIVETLRRGVGSAEDGRRLVEIVAERRGDAVRPALEELSGRRFPRAVRDAARHALQVRTHG